MNNLVITRLILNKNNKKENFKTDKMKENNLLQVE